MRTDVHDALPRQRRQVRRILRFSLMPCERELASPAAPCSRPMTFALYGRRKKEPRSLIVVLSGPPSL